MDQLEVKFFGGTNETLSGHAVVKFKVTSSDIDSQNVNARLLQVPGKDKTDLLFCIYYGFYINESFLMF